MTITRHERTGQDFTQLYSPLVKAVDIPDRSLGEGHMLVVGDQSAEGARGDLLSQDGRRRSIAQEGFMRNEIVGGTLGLDFLRRLPHHQGFRLSEEIGGQHPSRR